MILSDIKFMNRCSFTIQFKKISEVLQGVLKTVSEVATLRINLDGAATTQLQAS